MNTLIRNAYILTMDGEDRIFSRGAVAVRDGRVAWVGDEGSLPADFQAGKTLDARGGVVMPGFVNAHSHLAMTLLRGYGSDLNLQDWLEKKVFPAEDKLAAGDCYWGSMLGLMEMIRSGTTAFLDMYFFMDETARAVEEAGMRAVLSRGITGISPNFPAALKEAEALYRDWNGAASGRIRVMMAPHAEYTSPEAALRQVVELAHKLGCGIHTHLQETAAETDGCRARHGMSTTRWFEHVGLFSRHTVAAHCVTLDEDDIGILSQYNVSAAHCPGSNMKLASGIAPVTAMRKAGVNVAIGTDGASSNNNLDMLEELRFAALTAKIHDGDPIALGAYNALKMATMGDARALEIDNISGSIEVGKDADIIIFSEDSPSMHPDIDRVSNIVYSASSADVSTVMVQGRILMENGIILSADLERIYREAQKIAARICGL